MERFHGASRIMVAADPVFRIAILNSES